MLWFSSVLLFYFELLYWMRFYKNRSFEKSPTFSYYFLLFCRLLSILSQCSFSSALFFSLFLWVQEPIILEGQYFMVVQGFVHQLYAPFYSISLIIVNIFICQQYQATGRGFVVRHIKFSENYRLYSRSHFVKGWGLSFL